MGFVDVDKVEKIIFNLLSNALKFTPPGGKVDVICSFSESGMLNVSVLDTGIGLDEDKLDSLFERFAQIAPQQKQGGTGIGLYFTKTLVELHHGFILARNRYSDSDPTLKQGSAFEFSIPFHEKAFSAEEREAPSDFLVSLDNDAVKEVFPAEIEGVYDADKASVLLIDDDYEIVYYLKSLLSPNYNVHFRFDAVSGYNQIKEIEPDVIICDVMMLDVDGLQFCKMVKDNIEMCHIPIIMLTAKSSVEDQINSLNVGADAYVVKPFNPAYLQALVKSMIENRNRVKQILTSSVTVSSDSAQRMSIKDKELMDKVYKNLESSLAEGEIDIDRMVEKLGVSRSKFFYKIKALTGQTPGEFFTTYKLNIAAKMIVEGKFKISAIASMVGFSSASHFSIVFKKQFGVLPSQYRDSLDKTDA